MVNDNNFPGPPFFSFLFVIAIAPNALHLYVLRKEQDFGQGARQE
jgi:hypothetical protein